MNVVRNDHCRRFINFVELKLLYARWFPNVWFDEFSTHSAKRGVLFAIRFAFEDLREWVRNVNVQHFFTTRVFRAFRSRELSSFLFPQSRLFLVFFRPLDERVTVSDFPAFLIRSDWIFPLFFPSACLVFPPPNSDANTYVLMNSRWKFQRCSHSFMIVLFSACLTFKRCARCDIRSIISEKTASGAKILHSFIKKPSTVKSRRLRSIRMETFSWNYPKMGKTDRPERSTPYRGFSIVSHARTLAPCLLEDVKAGHVRKRLKSLFLSRMLCVCVGGNGSTRDGRMGKGWRPLTEKTA